MKEYFANHGLTEVEAEILAEYCKRSGNTKERALCFADEILAEYESRCEISAAASALGKLGGSKTSPAKKKSSAENGKKGGRPKKNS